MRCLCIIVDSGRGADLASGTSSKNVTIQNSVGFVTPNDSVYTNLPTDARKPPAPIDPSSESLFFMKTNLTWMLMHP